MNTRRRVIPRTAENMRELADVLKEHVETAMEVSQKMRELQIAEVFVPGFQGTKKGLESLGVLLSSAIHQCSTARQNAKLEPTKVRRK